MPSFRFTLFSSRHVISGQHVAAHTVASHLRTRPLRLSAYNRDEQASRSRAHRWGAGVCRRQAVPSRTVGKGHDTT